MNTLAHQQHALLDALFAWPPENATNNIANYVENTGARGLKAYQSNGHAMAERALQSAYPVLAQLLGNESFSALARAFWHAQPPVRGDLAQWGEQLIGYVRASEQLTAEPYLADVASAEWALHRCASAADRPLDTASFALLMQEDPNSLQLRLAPGCAVVHSRWPVVSILGAHLLGAPGFEEAGARLRRAVAEVAVVWRSGLRPCVREAVTGEADLLAALLDERPLGQALDGAPGLDFTSWLPMAVQTGLVLGASHHPA